MTVAFFSSDVRLLTFRLRVLSIPGRPKKGYHRTYHHRELAQDETRHDGQRQSLVWRQSGRTFVHMLWPATAPKAKPCSLEFLDEQKETGSAPLIHSLGGELTAVRGAWRRVVCGPTGMHEVIELDPFETLYSVSLWTYQPKPVALGRCTVRLDCPAILPAAEATRLKSLTKQGLK